MHVLSLRETVNSLRAGTISIFLYPIQPSTHSLGNQSVTDLTWIYQTVIFKNNTFVEMCICLQRLKGKCSMKSGIIRSDYHGVNYVLIRVKLEGNR